MWWKSSGIATIFFDGESKGNPGISSVGGMVFSLDLSSQTSFSWGLGVSSNNQAKIYSLLKACQIGKEKGFQSIRIFGDSEILIKMINSEEQFSNPSLNKTLQLIRNILNDFESVSSYHILCELNNHVDLMANKACHLPLGNLNINGEPSSF